MSHRLGAFFLSILAVCACMGIALADSDIENRTYHIGVLARRGIEQCRQSWSPTAAYLNDRIPEARFDIVPLPFEEVTPAVLAGKVDFVIVNSSIYVELQMRYGVSRLITQKDAAGEHGTLFGGVIFCLKDRKDINSLDDLRGKSFAAADPTSLGGWRAAWREIKAAGIDPHREFRPLTFAGTHDNVVDAVRNGLADAGTIATPILELMGEEKKLDLSEFKILNQMKHPGFPYLHSTRLYPAWPLSKLPHTPEKLAEKVVIALLSMPPDSQAARASQCVGWTVPSDYASVDECLKELGIGPYADQRKASLMQVLAYYRVWIVFGLCGLTFLVLVLLYILHLNRHLQTSKEVLELEVTERILAAQALRESQRRLSTLMSNLPGMAYRCLNDTHWTMLFVSGGCFDVTGYRPEELVENAGAAFAELIHPDDRTHVRDEIQNALDAGVPFHITYRIRTAAGVERWVIEQGRGVFSDTGVLIALEGFIQDITEHRNAGDALKASEEKFRTMIESIPIGIHLYELQDDGEMVYRGANPEADRIREQDTGGLVGRSILEAFPGLMGTEMPEAYRNVAMYGEPWHIDHVRYEDEYVAGDFSINAVRTSPRRIAVCFQNITDKRKAEEALRSSEEKFRSLIENGLDLITIASVDGAIRYQSPSVERVLGYTPEELTGINSFDLLHPEDLAKCTALIEKLCEEPANPGFLEFRIHHKNGSWRTLEGVAKNFLHDPGISGLIINSRDVTDRKLLEERLRQSQKMEAVGTLAGGIAHDFNNILAAIIGYTELALLQAISRDAAQNSLEQVLKAAFRARDVVKQILMFTRARDEEGLQPVRLGPILEEGLKLLRASLPATIEIRADLHCRNDLVLADATQLHQVLINLCTNAAHAMEERGGVLDVSLHAAEPVELFDILPPNVPPVPTLVLTVSDTGCGMEPAVVERIFDPYFTTKEVGKGTGLGLAVVHGIVERHRGWVRVASEPGRGSTFGIYFPRIDRITAQKAEAEGDIPGGTERLLFVDDEKALVDVARMMLENLGYDVTAVMSGLEALKLFEADPMRFDLILTDFTMPQMTGAELAREILKRRPDVPIILCTGFTERIDDRRAKEMGISEFVMKPIDMKALARLLRKVLDRRSRLTP